MDKIKILYLIESLSGGGAEKVLSTTIKNLNPSLFDITLCCVTDIGEYKEEILPYVNYYSILPNPNNYSRFKKLLYRLFYKSIYNWLPLSFVYRLYIPHSSHIEIAYVEGFATKLLSHSTNKRTKKIAWVHTDLVHNHWTDIIYKDIKEEAFAYSKYQQIITISKTAENAFLQTFNNINVPTRTLYNPVDCEEIIRKSKEDKNIPDPHPNVLRIVSVGRLTKLKGYERLLSIIHQLKKERYSIELWLIGDGDQVTNLKSFVENNNLYELVKFWGYQSNPYCIMSKCNLFVCSSFSEGYSTAVTESLVLGIPVITTDCSGMHELLEDNKYGIITENSESALYKGIKLFLDTPELLNHYKNQAIKRGKDFSLPFLIRQIESLLLE